jgi:hypothetical protein
MDDVKTDGRGKIVRLWRDWEEGRITDRRTRDDRRASSVTWTKDDVKTDGRGKMIRLQIADCGMKNGTGNAEFGFPIAE